MTEPSHGPRLNYASPDAPEAEPANGGRPIIRWLQLAGIWIVGLAVWTVYIAGMVYVFFAYMV